MVRFSHLVENWAEKLSLFHHKLVTWWLLQKTNVEHLFKANETKMMENCLQLSDKNGASSFESRDREFQIGKSRAETDIEIEKWPRVSVFESRESRYRAISNDKLSPTEAIVC